MEATWEEKCHCGNPILFAWVSGVCKKDKCTDHAYWVERLLAEHTEAYNCVSPEEVS